MISVVCSLGIRQVIGLADRHRLAASPRVAVSQEYTLTDAKTLGEAGSRVATLDITARLSTISTHRCRHINVVSGSLLPSRDGVDASRSRRIGGLMRRSINRWTAVQ